jgi:hypothetical protein
MKDESTNLGGTPIGATDTPSMPAAVDRATFQAELDKLRVREKAHTREPCTDAGSRGRTRPPAGHNNGESAEATSRGSTDAPSLNGRDLRLDALTTSPRPERNPS